MPISAVNELLLKQVTRRQFFWTTVLLFAAVTGVSGILKSISDATHEKPRQGFGSGPYGM
jgi:hypothetical protein